MLTLSTFFFPFPIRSAQSGDCRRAGRRDGGQILQSGQHDRVEVYHKQGPTAYQLRDVEARHADVKLRHQPGWHQVGVISL